MKKNLALKINNAEEAGFCCQILKKVGIFPINNLHLTFGKSRDHLFVENGKYFFTYKEIVDNAIGRGNITLVDSWREFVLNYLGNFYYLCRNKQEKEKLIDIICKNELNEKGNFISPVNMDSCYFEQWVGMMCFSRSQPENKQEISLDNLTLLINSVGQFEKLTIKTENKTNKTNKTINNTVIHLKDKKERAAAKVYLDGFFKENGLDIKFCFSSFNVNRNDCVYFQCLEMVRSFTISSWSDYHKPDKYTNVFGFADLEEFAQLIKEEKEKEKDFTFENGLVAKYNEDNRHIIIGCKEKDLGFWRRFTNQIVELNEGFKISSYSFTTNEAKEFKKWLENL